MRHLGQSLSSPRQTGRRFSIKRPLRAPRGCIDRGPRVYLNQPGRKLEIAGAKAERKIGGDAGGLYLHWGPRDREGMDDEWMAKGWRTDAADGGRGIASGG